METPGSSVFVCESCGLRQSASSTASDSPVCEKCGGPLGPGRAHEPDPVQTPAQTGDAEGERRDSRTRPRLYPGLLYLVLVPFWLILAVAGAVATEEPTPGPPGNREGRLIGGVIVSLLVALLIRWGWLRLIKKSHEPVISPLVFVIAIGLVLPTGLPHVGSLVSGDLQLGAELDPVQTPAPAGGAGGDPSTARNPSAESFFGGVEGYEFVDPPQELVEAQRASIESEMAGTGFSIPDFSTKAVVGGGGEMTGMIVSMFVFDLNPKTMSPGFQKGYLEGLTQTMGERPEPLAIGGEKGYVFRTLRSDVVVVWLAPNVPCLLGGGPLEVLQPVAEALLEAH